MACTGPQTLEAFITLLNVVGDGGEATGFLDLYRAVLRDAPVPVVISRVADQRIVKVNDAACEFFARSASELLSLGVGDVTAPEDRDDLPANFETMAVTGLVKDKTYVRGDGSTVHGRVHGSVVGDDTGSCALAAAMIFDTSDLIGSRVRLALIDEITDIIRGSDPVFDEAEWRRRSSAVEDAVERALGWSARIEWDALADADRSSSDGPAVSESVVDGDDVVGRLTVGGPDVDDEDRPFVSTLAHVVANLHLLRRAYVRVRRSMMFEAGFDATQVGMKILRPDGTIIRVNDAFARMLGYRADDLVGRTRDDISHPDETTSAVAARAAALSDSGHHDELRRYVRADGSTMWGRSRVTSVVDPSGRFDEIQLAHVVDLTSEIEARTALETSEQRYRSLVEPAIDLVLRVDSDKRIIDANASARRALGDDGDGLTGVKLVSRLPSDLRVVLAGCIDDAFASRQPAQSWRHWIELDDRPAGWYSIRVLPELTDDDAPIEHVYVVFTDVSELVESELRLSTLALLDPVTGCASRAAAFDRLEHALERLARHPEQGVAVAVLDLDHFRSVNDTFGHATGDEVLRTAAEIITSFVREEDTVGRLGGDEFIVIFEDVADRQSAHALGGRLVTGLSGATATVGNDVRIPISASVGVSWSNRRLPTEDFVARADRAMFEARRRGRGSIQADADTDPHPSSSSELLRQLANALHNDEFRLLYQPIVDATRGDTVAVEALIRWEHPERGLLTPDWFLGPLLQTGLIGQVGHWVVREACRQLAAWDAAGAATPDRVHFNATPAELADPRLAGVVRDAAAMHGIDPRRLCVEVTEQALAGTVVSTSTLAELSAVGPTIVLDDFGTGVSSLTHLRTRPLDGIKIDRQFIDGATNDATDRSIVEAMIALASSMEIEVVAEGVETDDQLAWLTECGCDLVQGWLYSKALPPDELLDWMSSVRT